MIIDGKKIAGEMIVELKKLPKPEKFLGAILIGENPASVSFLKQKENVAKELGVDFRLYTFPETITQDELRKEVLKIALHNTCGGVIVQLPLPGHINAQYVLNAIPREKDVDVLGERASGASYVGRNTVLPPAVGVVEKVLDALNLKLSIAYVAVVGAGFLVGKPVISWLTGKVPELCVCDKGSNYSALKNADLVISGAGVPRLLKRDFFKKDAIVIDFGYSMLGGAIAGDLDPDAYDAISAYTPTPGGTGPILVAQLFENFYDLNK